MVTDDSKTHIDPADFYRPDRPKIPVSAYTQYWYYGVVPPSFCAIVAMHNYFNRRPTFTGIPKYAASIVGGLFLAHFVTKLQASVAARRDDKIYRYIINHPDDFPPVERSKYKDVLEMWTPIR